VSETLDLITTRNVGTVHEFMRLLEAKDMAGWKDLWAEDADHYYPFGVEMFPPHMSGRETIAEHWAGLPQLFLSMSFPIEEVWSDADTVVARFNGVCVLADGRDYRNAYLSIWRFATDGKIQSYAEYFDPIVAGEAFGMLSVTYTGDGQ
jgi:ketosteroid isomerase-like protein